MDARPGGHRTIFRCGGKSPKLFQRNIADRLEEIFSTSYSKFVESPCKNEGRNSAFSTASLHTMAAHRRQSLSRDWIALPHRIRRQLFEIDARVTPRPKKGHLDVPLRSRFASRFTAIYIWGPIATAELTQAKRLYGIRDLISCDQAANILTFQIKSHGFESSHGRLT